MTTREVWTHNDLDVEIYEDDGNGTVVNPSIILFGPCYLQSASLLESLETLKRECTGRSRRRIHTRQHEYSGQIDHFFYSARLEHDRTNVFNRAKKLQIWFRLEKPQYTGTPPLENDLLKVKIAVFDTWRINSRDDEVIDASATFVGEDYEQSHY